jgi:hypothetical protein
LEARRLAAHIRRNDHQRPSSSTLSAGLDEWNPSAESAKCLVIYAPAGFEDFFAELIKATEDAPRGPTDYARTLPTILRIQGKYGMRRRG